NGDLLLFWARPPSANGQSPDFQISGEVFAGDGTLLTRLRDQRPAGYAYPVTRWPPGQIVMGRIRATQWLGDQVVDGTYGLRLSVYPVASGERLRLIAAGEADFIELTPLLVRID
ncbi:MAG: hypothetical protein M3Q45_10080, partial [Chloroflexota bacterium]|nr:hypothetical protein [Chloroflexota bacterium]